MGLQGESGPEVTVWDSQLNVWHGSCFTVGLTTLGDRTYDGDNVEGFGIVALDV